MEHFPIIQSLCRIAMSDPKPALRKQVERLRNALEKNGDTKHASALTRILNNSERLNEITPNRIIQSGVNLPREALGPNVNVPVDKETAAPLAEIFFPTDIEEFAPLFNSTVTNAISSIIEEWNIGEQLAEYGIVPSKSCVIYGVPGSGKTRLAFWITKQLNLPVVLVRIDGLVSSFLGTTAKNVANLFNFANRYHCVLLLDEFDAIAKVRDDKNEVGEIKRVVNALLQNLDKRQNIGITIGITNHANLLDPAIWRRFEIQLAIPKPDFDVRLEIAKQFFPPLEISESHLKLIAWFTEEATGAEIEALVRAYKKNHVMNMDKKTDLFKFLQQFAILNSARIKENHRDLIFGNPTGLLKKLRLDPQLKLSVKEISEIVGKDKSTISRWLGKKRARVSPGKEKTD